jgi:hypothetical protein
VRSAPDTLEFLSRCFPLVKLPLSDLSPAFQARHRVLLAN